MLILSVFCFIFASEIVPNNTLKLINMKFKSDFRKRLILLQDAISLCLKLDDSCELSYRCILFPRLFSVLSCLWCDKSKVFKDGNKGISESKK